MLWLLVAVGCLVIGGLSFYAGQLLFKLKAQNDKVAELKKQRTDYLVTSIKTIAFAMESEQCELSEGSIRIAVLLDNAKNLISEADPYQQKYPALFDLYSRIKHMPTHEARKHFSKKEIRDMDSERLKYEDELREKILTEVKRLKEFTLP